MVDRTENIRRHMVSEINSNPTERELLEMEHGKDNVWDTSELTKEFNVEGFLAPFCVVTKKSTGERGTVMFQHSPRFYFDFNPK